MHLGEKRRNVMQSLINKPFIYGGMSMMVRDETDIAVSDDYCPKCHEEMVNAVISTDYRSWANMCGSKGYLVICPYCGYRGSFTLTELN